MKLSRLLLNAVAVAACVIPTRAADFAATGINARSVAQGGVDILNDGDVFDAMSRNPASLATVFRSSLNMSAAGLFGSGNFRNVVDSHGTLKSNVGVIPAAAFGTRLGHTRFHAGLAITPEAVAVASWRYIDPPGATAGASYGLQTQKSAFLALRSSAGLGIELGRRFAVGISVGAIYNSNTFNAPYILQSDPALKGLKSKLDLNTTGVGWNTTVGVIARPSRSVELAASFKTRASLHTTGTADGDASAQFAALGVQFAPTFHYTAAVETAIPQSTSAGVKWNALPWLRWKAQTDFIQWASSFDTLRITLTNGTNPDINALTGPRALKDDVPLNWRNQLIVRTGFEIPVGESLALRGGYSWGNNPVPSSTLTPLTAANLQTAISTGVGYGKGPWTLDVAYRYHLPESASVGESVLVGGEYSHTSLRVSVHALVVSGSWSW